MGAKNFACGIRPGFLTLDFSNDIYRSEESKKPGGEGRGEDGATKNFKEVKEDLAAVLEKNEAIRRTQQKERG